MFCKKCGKQVKDGAQFCQYCGERISAAGAPGPKFKPEPDSSKGKQPQKQPSEEHPPKGSQLEAQMPEAAAGPSGYSSAPGPSKRGGIPRNVIIAAVAAVIVIGGFFIWLSRGDKPEGEPGREETSAALAEKPPEESPRPSDETEEEKLPETEETVGQKEPDGPSGRAAGKQEEEPEASGTGLQEEEPAESAQVPEEEGSEESAQMPEEEEAAAVDHGSYILPDSDSRYLTMADLEGLSQYECRLARNELYARHGRKFNAADLQDYFNRCEWYHGRIEPENFHDESMLNQYEIANRDLIVQYEKDMGYQ